MDTEEEERKNCAGSDWFHALLEIISNGEQEDSDEVSCYPVKKGFKDISFNAVWSLSSCKVDGDGFGIHELLSDSVEHYWQSDGPQPHCVTVEFPRKTDICFIALYLDYKTDESYTPSKIHIRYGSSLMHLEGNVEATFSEPNGWRMIDLRKDTKHPIRAFVVQLQVLQNHQNGRDTHIRHMRVIGPSQSRYDADARVLVSSSQRGEHPLWPDELENTQPYLPITSLSGKLKNMTVIR